MNQFPEHNEISKQSTELYILYFLSQRKKRCLRAECGTQKIAVATKPHFIKRITCMKRKKL